MSRLLPVVLFPWARLRSRVANRVCFDFCLLRQVHVQDLPVHWSRRHIPDLRPFDTSAMTDCNLELHPYPSGTWNQGYIAQPHHLYPRLCGTTSRLLRNPVRYRLRCEIYSPTEPVNGHSPVLPNAETTLSPRQCPA